MFNEQHKKESPILGLVGLGGGIARARGGGSESYWILTKYRSESSKVEYAYGVDTDSSGNIVAVGQAYDGTNDGLCLLKLDKDGATIFEKELRHTGSTTNQNVILDASDNIYVVNNVSDNMYLAKIASDGSSVTWQYKYYKSGQADSFNHALDTDVSGNVYLGGSARPTGFNANGTIAPFYKVNSSGTLQWFKLLDSTNSTGDRILDLVVDSYGNSAYPNIFAVGPNDYGTNGTSAMIIKSSRDGVVSVQKFIGASLADGEPRLAVHEGNPHMVWEQNVSGGKTIQVAKFNNSLSAVTWERSLSGSAYLSVKGIAIDSSGNVFVGFGGGRSTIGNGTAADHIAKYNSSGVLQWQMSIGSNYGGSSSAYVRFTKLHVDANDNLIVSAYGYDYSSSRFIVLKLPTTDPIANGTYDNFVFSTTTATDSAGSSTLATGSLGVSDATYLSSSMSLTYGDQTLSSTKTDLPV